MSGSVSSKRKANVAKESTAKEIDMSVLRDKLGFRIRMLDRQLTRVFSQKAGMTPVQFSVFSLVATNEDLSQVAIGEALGMDRASTMAIVHKLEEAGLLLRRKAIHDRRVHALQLTEKGRKEFIAVNKKVSEYDSKFSDRLTATEMENLNNYLRKLMG